MYILFLFLNIIQIINKHIEYLGVAIYLNFESRFRAITSLVFCMPYIS